MEASPEGVSNQILPDFDLLELDNVENFKSSVLKAIKQGLTHKLLNELSKIDKNTYPDITRFLQLSFRPDLSLRSYLETQNVDFATLRSFFARHLVEKLKSFSLIPEDCNDLEREKRNISSKFNSIEADISQVFNGGIRFLFELIQNADDCKATEVTITFETTNDKYVTFSKTNNYNYNHRFFHLYNDCYFVV